MLPENIELDIVTPERFVLQETVQSVELPGKEGYMGILPGHAPLLSELGIGTLSYRKGSDVEFFAVIKGFVEVLPGRVIVLADACERAEEIDVARARAALDKAKSEMAKKSSVDADWDRASFAVNRALARLQAAAKAGVAGVVEEVSRH
ncbi:MAG TPA: F0F1 ATP synthase subunit epsilon [Candidatus Acidoferrales bacterium]|nr:F0F1 ATP synthase subunit epsilon [Candidatus Acidoferrales bacterium]